MRVVLAHDFVRHGGAERVLEQLHLIWPEAPVYTLLYERNPEYANWDIRPSWLQRVVPQARYRWPLMLYPGMVDRMKVPRDIDLLVTSSVSWMKSLRSPSGVPHLCYIHRPMMFAYERQEDFLALYPRLLRPLLRVVSARIRRWDQRTADRPTLYLANSRYTAERVRQYYGREAEVVPPPVRIEHFEEAGHRIPPGEYYLTVQRLETYKRVDVLVQACSRLGLSFKVAGKGPDLERLRSLAGPTVEFLGFVPEQDLPRLMAGCRAFLFSAEEDFGISPVEAQAAGRPVVAYAAGGCLETVVPGVTGLHYAKQTPESLMAVLEQFNPDAFDPEVIRAHARGFSQQAFRERILDAATRLVRSASAGPRPEGSGHGASASPE